MVDRLHGDLGKVAVVLRRQLGGIVAGGSDIPDEFLIGRLDRDWGVGFVAFEALQGTLRWEIHGSKNSLDARIDHFQVVEESVG